MSTIGPCLWFDGQAEEAAEFYVSVFKNSRILGKTHFMEGLPGPVGQVMTVSFVLDGAPFVGLNGGPHFQFSPAISFLATCDSQPEVDDLWVRLSEGGREEPCGWVTDRYGVSWQIIPKAFLAMLEGGDAAATRRVTTAMLGMRKPDLALLQRAFEGA